MNHIVQKKISLEKRLSSLFAGLYASIMIIVFLFWSGSVIQYQEKRETSVQEEVKSYASRVSYDIAQVNAIILRLFTDNKMERLLSNNELETYDAIYELMEDINIWVEMNASIDGIFIYYGDGNDVIYKMSEDLTVTKKEALLNRTQIQLTSSESQNGYFIQSIENTVYDTIYYSRLGIHVVGLVNVNRCMEGYESEPLSVSTGIEERERYWEVTRDESKYVSAEQKNKIRYEGVIENTDLKVICEVIPEWSWYLSAQHIGILCLMLMSFVPARSMFILLKSQILNPLAEMTGIMQRIQRGELDVDFHINTNLEEIENVNQALEVMTKEIQNLKIQKYEEVVNRQKAQLQYLQTQLNPHFYINCLKLIQAKLVLGYEKEVENFLIQLSIHFRYLMKRATDLVTVREEMDFVTNYLDMTRGMVSRKITCRIQVDPDAQQFMLPILAVQTFVENSIKYGKIWGKEELQIMIKVQVLQVEEGRFLNIAVRDNGTGFSQEQLDVLNRDIVELDENHSGIANLKKRIQLIYQSGYNWYFYNQEGAAMELLLPCGENRENECFTGR